MNEDSVKEKVLGFFMAFSVPQCLGAIDGTHIVIKQPLSNYSDYINRKLSFSLNVQALCDYQYHFMDVVVNSTRNRSMSKWLGHLSVATVNSSHRLYLTGT